MRSYAVRRILLAFPIIFIIRVVLFLLGRYPVVNVPNGITKENIPLGMQIIANTYDDLTAFQLAHAYSKVDPGFFSKKFPDFS